MMTVTEKMFFLPQNKEEVLPVVPPSHNMDFDSDSDGEDHNALDLKLPI